MSVQAISWALGAKCISASEKAVLFVLANYADEHGKCWPSQRTVAAQACVSERTVRRVMADMEARSLISREMRSRHDGSRQSDITILSLKSAPDTMSGGADTVTGGADTMSHQPDTMSGHDTKDNHQGYSKPERFEDAWVAWPEGQGRNCGKPEACRAWLGQMKAGSDEADMLSAVKAYAKKTDREYAMRFDKFMRDEVWREYRLAKPEDEADLWRVRLAAWVKLGRWSEKWGADPDSPACKAPAKLIRQAQDRAS